MNIKVYWSKCSKCM